MSDFRASSALFFFVALGAYIPINAALYFFKRTRGIKIQPVRSAARLFLAVSVALALAVSLFPVHFDIETKVPMFDSSQLSLVPFHSLFSLFSTFGDPVAYWQAGLEVTLKPIIGGILLLLPLGFFLPQCGRVFRRFRNCALTAFAFSIFIETARYTEAIYCLANGISADIDTIILNMAGFCIGYALFTSLKKHMLRMVIQSSTQQHTKG